MEFKIGCKYILRIDVLGKILTYTCTIISVDEDSIAFKDRFSEKMQYKKELIISADEVKDE